MSQKLQKKNFAKYRNQQAYQSLPTINMDNPAMTSSNDNTTDALRSAAADDTSSDRNSVSDGVGLPSTYSSQQLMPSSDSDSIEDNTLHHQRLSAGGVGGGATGGGITTTNRSNNTLTMSNWYPVVVLCYVNLINYMDRFTIAGVLVDIQTDFKIGDDDGGLLQTAFIVSYMVFAPLFGYLGDRYSRRWLMAIGVSLWSSTTLLGSFMKNFPSFIMFRAMVGIGEASYSTIAPTLISDLFVHESRSKMLAVFYFAIPVGSGLGYIIGAETARIANDWRWALRVTPFLGVIAVILLLTLKEPKRGQSEGRFDELLSKTTYQQDVKLLLKNKSFVLTTFGFTCVAFVCGALAWFGPKVLYLGLRMQPDNVNITLNDVSYKFGIVAMFAGLIGVPLGSYAAQRLRPSIPNVDPYICAFGTLVSAPLVFTALMLPQRSITWCLIAVFFAQTTLNLCWSIVADMLLYVVVPTRRATAEAIQILISHAFGDAGSPYLIGLVSEALKPKLREQSLQNFSLIITNGTSDFPEDTDIVKFESLQYALFTTSFVEVLGGIFFLCTAAFILKDRALASNNNTRPVREIPAPAYD